MSDREQLFRSAGQPFEEWLLDFLSKVKGEKLDITAMIYEEIIAEEDAEAAFRYFLASADDIISEEEFEVPSHYTEAEREELQKNCASFVDGILQSALERNYPEDRFYSVLWQSINANPLLSEKNEIIYAIYLIWQDGCIPYFHLEKGMQMENEEFLALTRKNLQLLRKALFIMQSDLPQRTEVSDLLLKVLDACESEKDKAVVLAQILGAWEQILLKKAQPDE